MKFPFNISKPLYKHPDRLRLSNKFDQMKSDYMRDNPAVGKNLDCKVIDLTPEIESDLSTFLKFTRWTNENLFGFKVHDLPLSVNWNTYGVGNEYPYHVDFTDMGSACDIKLTAIVDLSHEAYDGGEFEFFWMGQEFLIKEFGPGTVLVFPSFIHHRVRPVKSGVRKSLSMWLTGPNWR